MHTKLDNYTKEHLLLLLQKMSGYEVAVLFQELGEKLEQTKIRLANKLFK